MTDGEPEIGTRSPPGPSVAEAGEGASRRRSNPSRRRRWGRILLVLLPILIAAGVLYYWFYMRPYESTDDAFIDGNVVPISPQVSGLIAKRFVQDNQAVKQGALLFQIDPRDYEAALAEAKASLESATSKEEQARAQEKADQALVGQAQAHLAAAQTEAERAAADLKRYESLQSAAVSRSQLDLARAQARSTAAAVEVARSQVHAAEAQVRLARAGIQSAVAEVHRNEAVVTQAQLELSYTKLTAPVDGFVTHRTVEAGAYVQKGQNLVAIVPDRVWVTANFKETQLTFMRPGQPVNIHVDAFPNHEFHGHVDSIQRGSGARFSLLPPENTSGNYVKVVQRVPVKILFDEQPNPNLPLGPGLSVEPKVRVLSSGKP